MIITDQASGLREKCQKIHGNLMRQTLPLITKSQLIFSFSEKIFASTFARILGYNMATNQEQLLVVNLVKKGPSRFIQCPALPSSEWRSPLQESQTLFPILFYPLFYPGNLEDLTFEKKEKKEKKEKLEKREIPTESPQTDLLLYELNRSDVSKSFQKGVELIVTFPGLSNPIQMLPLLKESPSRLFLFDSDENSLLRGFSFFKKMVSSWGQEPGKFIYLKNGNEPDLDSFKRCQQFSEMVWSRLKIPLTFLGLLPWNELTLDSGAFFRLTPEFTKSLQPKAFQQGTPKKAYSHFYLKLNQTFLKEPPLSYFFSEGDTFGR